MGSGPPFPATVFVTMGARAPVPYGVSATISDILMVNPAGVIDVFSL